MAGTKTSAEGLPSFRVSTVLSADSSSVNSLEGMDVQSLTDNAIAYVQQANEEYRWFPDSLEAPSSTVILPAGQTLSEPGRWILITGGGGGGYPPGDEFNQVLTWNPAEETYLPLGMIATYVIATVAQLEEYFPAVDGVHVIEPIVKIEFQGEGVFDLGTNRIEITGEAQIFGWGKTGITSAVEGATITVRSDVVFHDIEIKNTAGAAGFCLEVNIPLASGFQRQCTLVDCALGQIAPGVEDEWGHPARVQSGILKAFNTSIGEGSIFLDGNEGESAPALWLSQCPFLVNSVTMWGVEVNIQSTHVRVDGCEMRGSRAGIVRISDTGQTSLVELLNNVEGFAGSLSDNALVVDPAAVANSSFVISGNTLAGGISLTANEFSSVQIQNNRFIAHQNARVPFTGFTPADVGVCCRNNYDFDTFAYLTETALV